MFAYCSKFWTEWYDKPNDAKLEFPNLWELLVVIYSSDTFEIRDDEFVPHLLENPVPSLPEKNQSSSNCDTGLSLPLSSFYTKSLEDLENWGFVYGNDDIDLPI